MNKSNLFKNVFVSGLIVFATQSCGGSKEFTVTFNTDGGTAIPSQKVKANDTAKRPDEIPTREDGVFVDWYKDENKKEVYNFNEKVTNDITIYAKYNLITSISAVGPNRYFKVGDEIKKSDFVVTLNYADGTKKVTDNFTCPELKDEKYTFSLTDIYENGKFKEGKIFNFKYLNFSTSLTILPDLVDDTKFEIQYINLIKGDSLSRNAIYDSNEINSYSFESSDTSKLIIDGKKLEDNHITITYHLTKNVSKNDKIYIKVLDSNKQDAVIDFLLIQIFDNSDNSLGFNLNEDQVSYNVTCNLTYDKRTDWDPSGIGSLLIPTYPLDKNYPVTILGKSNNDNAFKNCSKFTNIELPETLKEIGDYKFDSCNKLKTIYIPSSVETIGSFSFNNCYDLENITYPNNTKVTSFGNYTFQNATNLTNFTIPNSVIKLGTGCFNNCKNLSKLIIPNDSMLTSIGSKCFNGVSENIINDEGDSKYLIAQDEKGVPNTHFALTSISVDVKEYNINEDCFIISPFDESNKLTLTKITIPNKITAIASCAFKGCTQLKDVIIDAYNSNLLGIGDNAFYCDSSMQKYGSITSINIPSKVKFIGYDSFHGQNSLSEANFKNPKGWFKIKSDTEQEQINENDLNDCKIAANLLKSNSYDWVRK